MTVTEPVIIALIGLAGSSAVGALISGLINGHQRRQERKRGIGAGVRFLLRGEIRRNCLRYIRRGSLTPDELEELLDAHRVYHDDLGGNGYLDEIMDRVRALPLK